MNQEEKRLEIRDVEHTLNADEKIRHISRLQIRIHYTCTHHWFHFTLAELLNIHARLLNEG